MILPVLKASLETPGVLQDREKLPITSGTGFPSSATLALTWFTAPRSFGQAHGIFVESAECSTELLGKSCYYSKQ